MENHPIPQDVTGFKFKLIGSVTVKQFLYLLGFGILTTVSFAMPVSPLIRVPFMILFASIGAGLAFVPIEGRPMDVMLVKFAKLIPSENRFLYRKRGVNLSRFDFLTVDIRPKVATTVKTQTPAQAADSADDKRALLISRLRNSGFKPDEAETRTLNSIKNFFNEEPGKLPEQQKINKAKLAEVYAGNTIQQAPGSIHAAAIATPKENIAPPKPVMADAPPSEDMMNSVKKDAEERIKADLAASNATAKPEEDTAVAQAPQVELKLTEEKPQTAAPLINVPKTQVGWMPAQSPTSGFPSLPDVPNIVLGMVRDPRGKTLPNILVEVVDASGIPVRAFKTNALGQFASATPLPNGSYKVYFDDPQKQNELPPIDIVLNGEIFQPVEAVSVDDREKLRRELFGGATPGV